MEFPTMKARFALFAAIPVLAVIAFATLRSEPSPTDEERKQMDILSGQLFVFDGATNTIKRTRSFSAFEKQHEMMPYLQLLSPQFERYNWPKDRPVRVFDLGDQINVIWPLPPEVENKPIRWGPDFEHAALIDKKERKIMSLSQGS